MRLSLRLIPPELTPGDTTENSFRQPPASRDAAPTARRLTTFTAHPSWKNYPPSSHPPSADKASPHTSPAADTAPSRQHRTDNPRCILTRTERRSPYADPSEAERALNYCESGSRTRTMHSLQSVHAAPSRDSVVLGPPNTGPRGPASDGSPRTARLSPPQTPARTAHQAGHLTPT